jgi:hypothetical protein
MARELRGRLLVLKSEIEFEILRNSLSFAPSVGGNCSNCFAAPRGGDSFYEFRPITTLRGKFEAFTKMQDFS